MQGDAEHSILTHLEEVKQWMVRSLAETPLAFLTRDYSQLFGSGKMLRSRMIFRIGPASRIDPNTLIGAAAAVEMIHSASLLHDDVIDGGYLRRGAPAFWVDRGVSGAILLGDLLLFKAMELVMGLENGRLIPPLVKLTGAMCEAESEQELVLRGTPSRWEDCVRIARLKTGSLFAFAGHACGGTDAALCEKLQEAGFLIGTAYQLADDILDANGDPGTSDKTLGSDRARLKTTAATALLNSNISNPISFIDNLLEQAGTSLSAWPHVKQAWDMYLDLDIRPALHKNLTTLS